MDQKKEKRRMSIMSYHVINGHRRAKKVLVSPFKPEVPQCPVRIAVKYGSTNDAFARTHRAISVTTPSAICFTPRSSPGVGLTRVQSCSPL
jgi:hypothetical protein